MGDMIQQVYLDCGHMDTVTLRDASNRPCWMVADAIIEKGARGTCPWCNEKRTVVNVKLVKGWGDR